MIKSEWYNKNYKRLLIISAVVIIASIAYLWSFQNQQGDIIYKDVSLTGGTTVTILDPLADIDLVKSELSSQFPDLTIRGISDFRTGKQTGFLLETKANVEEIRSALEEILGYELTQDNSSVEFSGATLSQGFYQQLRLAILLAFFFMAIVVFLIFRTFVPSTAVVISAFADIAMTLVVVDLLGISLSTAGVVAFLLLIGYSVDTDILLTTRVLIKKEESINRRIFGAFKTGIVMSLTSILAVGVSLIIIYNSSDVLKQMFTILLIGLGFDIFNTWVTNASIIKWYAEAKENYRK
ncbi:MAG: protein translocase subunit SecF [Nanoarchaeota archaeon]|nr:protein translocase subunit SecF [Nanoarchaeota archaeon]